MAERLLSVGLDVGTTTTQLIVSRIRVENRASGFCVPEMDITGREILYESPVIFTPLVGRDLVDGQAIGSWVRHQYQMAGIRPEDVDSGAVIVTGETSRKENAAAVLEAVAQLAGDFVVATAGPDLESVLAAKGAGAVDYSERTGKPVLHMDIGGGTANLAWIENGQVVATGCLNVGGRLVKVEDGRISYLSPVLERLWAWGEAFPTSVKNQRFLTASPQGEAFGRMEVGEIATPVCALARNDVDYLGNCGEVGVSPPVSRRLTAPSSEGALGRMEVGEVADSGKLEALAGLLVQALEMAAGRREVTPLLEILWTKECGNDNPSVTPTGVTAPLKGSHGGFREGQDPPLQGRMEVGEIATPVCALARNDVDYLGNCGEVGVSPPVSRRLTAPSSEGALGRMEVGEWVISFSGGVADCMEGELEDFAFGDMGPILGKELRKSRLCQGQFMLGAQTIRATVIGAGCHSAQLSGSTVFCKNVALPLKNLPVAVVSQQEQLQPRVIAARLGQMDTAAVLAIPGFFGASYEQVGLLAQAILEGFGERPIYVCAENDMAKALGQRLCLALPEGRPCLCLDRVRLRQGSFLDVGLPVGPCMPVVVKTLIFNG